MNDENQHHTIKPLGADSKQSGLSRRGFLHGMGGLGALMGIGGLAGSASAAEPPKDAEGNVIPGFENGQDEPNAAKGWQPVSDRRIRVGIAGYGLCKFGAVFFYQNHPKNGKIDEFGWRRALPPMWYPTHATAYYVSVTGGRFTEVSGLGTESYYHDRTMKNTTARVCFLREAPERAIGGVSAALRLLKLDRRAGKKGG